MATGHTIGQDFTVEYNEKKQTLDIHIDNVSEFMETAKMKMAVSTSGFIECPIQLDGKVAKINLQFGINKPKSEHWT